MPTTTYNTTGVVHTFTVPSNVGRVYITCLGAGGADGQLDTADGEVGLGAVGGSAEAQVNVTPGEDLNARVGGGATDVNGGSNGGGDGGNELDNNGGGGGGASGVRRSGDTISDIVCLGAGGGGGGSTNQNNEAAGDGGRGGGTTGEDGQDASAAAGGAGGTQTSGASQIAGADGAGSGNNDVAAGGGGGAGYWGGGGGGQDLDASPGGAGGGGGSSFGDTTLLGGGNAGDGQVEILYAENPTLDTIDAGTENEVALTWTNNDTYDNVNIYRATSSGTDIGDYTQVTQLAGGTTSYTDTTVDDGVEYFYRITGIVDELETGVSNELNATTILPGASNLTAGTITDTSIDLNWTVNADNGTQRVEFKLSSDGSYSTFSSGLGLGTSSESITGLLNGETYDLRVVTETADATTIDTS